jgi:protein-tyrosine phosphatase
MLGNSLYEILKSPISFYLQHNHHEVPDPYYGGDAGFQLVVDLIEDGSKGLIEHLKKELGLS